MIISPQRRAALLYEESRSAHLEAGVTSIAASKAAKITVLSIADEMIKVWERNAYPHFNYHKVIAYWQTVKEETNRK